MKKEEEENIKKREKEEDMVLEIDNQIKSTEEKRKLLIRKKNREIYKENKEKRRERKKKLIKLGTLFFILDLLDEPQEIMLGFLKNYKDLSENEKEKYCEIGTEILATREQKKYPEAISEYKRMLHKMIIKSSLLEKEKIHLENPNTILGFLNSYKNLPEKTKEKYAQENKEFKNKRKLIATDYQKIELLKLSFLMNKDLTKIIQDLLKKTIHEITEDEVKIIESELVAKV